MRRAGLAALPTSLSSSISDHMHSRLPSRNCVHTVLVSATRCAAMLLQWALCAASILMMKACLAIQGSGLGRHFLLSLQRAQTRVGAKQQGQLGQATRHRQDPLPKLSSVSRAECCTPGRRANF